MMKGVRSGRPTCWPSRYLKNVSTGRPGALRRPMQHPQDVNHKRLAARQVPASKRELLIQHFKRSKELALDGERLHNAVNTLILLRLWASPGVFRSDCHRASPTTRCALSFSGLLVSTDLRRSRHNNWTRPPGPEGRERILFHMIDIPSF